jgi:hypothetical protein
VLAGERDVDRALEDDQQELGGIASLEQDGAAPATQSCRHRGDRLELRNREVREERHRA